MLFSEKSPFAIIAATSSVASPKDMAAGIGIVLSSADGRTLAKVAERITQPDPIAAAYVAAAAAAREAARLGARRLTLVTDSDRVARELQRQAAAAPEHRAKHLETRSLLNQFRQVRVLRVAPGRNLVARRLACLGFASGPLHRGPQERSPELPLLFPDAA